MSGRSHRRKDHVNHVNTMAHGQMWQYLMRMKNAEARNTLKLYIHARIFCLDGARILT